MTRGISSSHLLLGWIYSVEQQENIKASKLEAGGKSTSMGILIYKHLSIISCSRKEQRETSDSGMGDQDLLCSVSIKIYYSYIHKAKRQRVWIPPESTVFHPIYNSE